MFQLNCIIENQAGQQNFFSNFTAANKPVQNSTFSSSNFSPQQFKENVKHDRTSFEVDLSSRCVCVCLRFSVFLTIIIYFIALSCSVFLSCIFCPKIYWGWANCKGKKEKNASVSFSTAGHINSYNIIYSNDVLLLPI